MIYIISILALAGIGFLIYEGSKSNKTTTVTTPTKTESSIYPDKGYDVYYKKYGTLYGVDWRLLKAIALKESSERPNVTNTSDPSYGLMQVLCTDNGAGGCSNVFNVQGWPPATFQELFNPDYNVQIATQILKWDMNQYGTRKGIAVYNDWSARNQSEPFTNQAYLNQVMEYYNAIIAEGVE